MSEHHITVSVDRNDSPVGLFVNAVGWDYVTDLLLADTKVRMDAMRAYAEQNSVTVQGRFPALKPAVVTGVLAVELYAKTILKSEGTEVPRVHDLADLFKLVSAAAMKRTEELYAECFSKDEAMKQLQAGDTANDYSMAGVIGLCNKAFVEWRYYHEGVIHSHSPNISPLRRAMKKYLIEKNPEWVNLLEVDQRT